ncbi:MAG: tetratricopeptide repeat protein [Candidatus Rhabdochlamydia sp.]
MGISTKILTTSGLVKIPLPPVDHSHRKIRVYSLRDQMPSTLKKVKEALIQEQKKGRVFQGDWSQVDQDILSSPYLFKDEKHLMLISDEIMKSLQTGHIPSALDFTQQTMPNGCPLNCSSLLTSKNFDQEELGIKELIRDIQNKAEVNSRGQNISNQLSWEQSINDLEKKYPHSLARFFFNWISALKGECISEDLLNQLFDHTYPEKGRSEFEAALDHLVEYSLLKKSSSSLLKYYHTDLLTKHNVFRQLSAQDQKDLCLLIKGKVAKALNDLMKCKDDIKEYVSYRDHYIALLRMECIQATMTSEERYKNFLTVGNLFSQDHLYPEALLCFADAWEALQLVEKVDFNHQCQSLKLLGATCLKMDKFLEGSGYYQKALRIAQQFENDKEQLQLHHTLRNLYLSLKKYQQALENCEQALEIAKKLGDISEQRKIYGHLGDICYRLRNYRKKITYHEEELEIAIGLKDVSAEEKAYSDLGDSYDALGYHDEALTYYQSYLQMAKSSGHDEAKGKAYSKLGAVYNSLGHRLEAIEHHKEALMIAHYLKDDKEKGRVYGNLGHAYRSLGDATQAIQFYKQALEIAQDNQDDKEKERAYSNLGNMHRSLKQCQEAFDCHKQALEIAKRMNDLKKMGKAYNHLGNVCRSWGQYSEAIVHYQTSLKMAQENRDTIEEGRIHGSLGAAYSASGDYPQAIQHYTNALATAKQFNNLVEEGSIYNYLGTIHNSLRNYHEAIDHHQKSLDIALEIKNCVIEGRAYIHLGIVYHSLGDIHQAIQYYEKCLHIAIQLKDRAEEGRTYCNLGNAYDSLGDSYRAITYHEKDLQIALKLKDVMAQGRAYGNLGIIYESLRKYSEAIVYQEKALKINLYLKNRRDEGRIYSNLGNIYSSLEEYDSSIMYQKKALEIALAFNDRRDEGKIYSNLGNVYGALEDYQQAIAYYDKSLKIAEALQDHLGKEVNHGNLGNIYAARGEYALAETHLRTSIEVSALRQKEVKNFEWQITLFEEQSKQYLSLELLLLMQNKFFEALEVSDARRARALTSLIMQKNFSVHDKASSLEPLTVQKMQELAKKLRTTFVMYSLVDMSQLIQVWIIPSTGLAPIPITLPSAKDEFQDLHEIFKTFPYEVGIKRPKRGEKQPIDSFKEKLSNWYQLLIEPLTLHLPPLKPEEGLTIIPDGFLAHLPFGVFYQAENKRYLIENYPISIAPSIQVLSLLDQLPRSLSNTALLIGKNHEIDHSHFEKREVHEVVAPLFQASQKEILQEKATPNYLLEKASQSRWIHIACHGVTKVRSSEYLHSIFHGAFKLAPDDKHESGYLHSKEIAPMSIKADLVFMTASQLGLGNLQQEGSIGPVWSFLGAGALSTIASYWALPECTMTVKMVETFYKHYLGLGVSKLNKAQALREAVIMAMKIEPHNPRQWGGFFLSGLTE